MGKQKRGRQKFVNFSIMKGKLAYRKLLLIIVCVLLLVCIIGVFGYHNSQTRVVTISIARWITSPEYERNIEGFKAGLSEMGYVEGENVRFIVGNPEMSEKEQREIIKSFVDRRVDLIYSLGTPGSLIAKDMTSDIPVVFSLVTFPVESGLVRSLQDSGNNLVGTRNYVPVARQFYEFERIVPDVKVLGVVHDKENADSILQYREFMDLLAKRDIEVVDIAAASFKDIRDKLAKSIHKVDALYAACDGLIQKDGEEIVIEFSKRYKKPSFTCHESGVVKGALIGNVVDFYVIGRIAGQKASAILTGVEPSWLMTESQRTDYVVVNARTAKEFGIVIPEDVLADAKMIVGENKL